MRLLPISQVRPGMRLGKAIVSDEGHTLLGFGVELTGLLINKLRLMGYEQLYVEDPRTEDIIVQDVLREETRTVLRQNLLRAFQSIQKAGSLAGPAERQYFSKMTRQSLQLIHEDLRERHKADDPIIITDLNRRNLPPDEHFIQNAINVCVYAMCVGIQEKFSPDELEAIGIGALLHDIGNTQISPKLLQKASSLTPLEFAEIQKHPEHGYNLLKEMPGIPLLSAQCVLQHHEKVNGTGYPFRQASHDIHPFAQWIGLFDAYDAMINPRPYRAALSPDHALEILYAGAGTTFDRKKVELFRNKVAIYPIGLSVRLSTGESGMVSRINHWSKQRPVVRILSKPNGEDVESPYEIDLAEHLHIMIFRVGEDALVH